MTSHNINETSISDSSAKTKWLIEFTKGEIYSIRLCHECYVNANVFPVNWFIKPCKKHHLLVWAQQKTFPYYPAKLISVNNNNTVDVHFFGKHLRSVVSPKDCLMYTENFPGIKPVEHVESLAYAQKVKICCYYRI